VARSNATCSPQARRDVRFAGPRTLMPADAESLGVEVFDRLEPALEAPTW
jgi:hypothetical protein